MRIKKSNVEAIRPIGKEIHFHMSNGQIITKPRNKYYCNIMLEIEDMWESNYARICNLDW